MDNNRGVLLSSEQMCTVFQQHFVRLFGENYWSASVVNFTLYLDGLPQLLVTDARFCEKPITTSEIQEVMNNYTSCKSPCLEVFFLWNLFSSQICLADAYSNWQQNGQVSSTVSRRVIILLRKNAKKGSVLRKFWLITLLNTEFLIIAKVLAKKLTIVVGNLVGYDKRAQSRAGLSMTTSTFRWYIIESFRLKLVSVASWSI